LLVEGALSPSNCKAMGEYPPDIEPNERGGSASFAGGGGAEPQ
jgi:hypothetical protein